MRPQNDNRVAGVILASTFHVPPNQKVIWLRLLERCLPALKPHYSAIVVNVTCETSEIRVKTADNREVSMLEYLRQEGIRAEAFSSTIGDNHRNALNLAVATAQEPDFKACNIHYCDFDRILYWARNYPDDLRLFLVKARQVDVLFPVRRGLRSPKSWKTRNNAWSSHPLTQMATEYVILDSINTAYRELLSAGVGGFHLPDHAYYDPLGTSQVTSPAITSLLLQKSTYKIYPQTEWATIIVLEILDSSIMSIGNIDWVEVDGLRFETLELLKYVDELTSTYEDEYWTAFSALERSKTEAVRRTQFAIDALEYIIEVFHQYGFQQHSGVECLRRGIGKLQELLTMFDKFNNGNDVIAALNSFVFHNLTGNSKEFDFEPQRNNSPVARPGKH